MHTVHSLFGTETESKNTRRPRFSVEELDALVAAVSQRKAIVCNRFSDVLTNQTKNVAWTEITQAVNEVSRIKRDVTEMRKKWKDWQSVVKTKELTRRKLKGNPDAGNKFIFLTSAEEKVLALIGETAFEDIPDDGASALPLQQHPVKKKIKMCGAEPQQTNATPTESEPSVKSVKKVKKIKKKVVAEKQKQEEAELVEMPVMVNIDDGVNAPEPSQPMRSKFTSITEDIYRDDIGRQLLCVEMERLDVEKQRLEVEKERLQIEREKLELMRHHFKTNEVTDKPTQPGLILDM